MATLVGFASLDADTFAEGPVSGGDNGSVDAVRRIRPISANGRTGPFAGQPVQGFSGVQFVPNAGGDTFWFLSDNGFGAQTNSADYLLRLYRVDPDFVGSESGDGSVDVQGFIQLADPNDLIPFDIVQEDTSARYLTGADFDIESFVIAPNGDIWVGDEFGPFLLHFDSEGVLQEAPIATPSLVELNTLNGQEPLVIAHRGASGDFPEHTIEAYRAAIANGADFIEPDLVITSDGVLIARHEPILDDTTNVAEVFGPERQSTKILDGEEITAYFAEDFTWEEIQQLRAVQSRDFRDPSFDGLFKIPSLEQIIATVQQVEAETGVQVGIYPETKHPTFFDEQGLSLEEPLVQTLLDTGFTDPARIFIQSFEVSNLLDLQQQFTDAGLGDIPLVQLFGDTDGSFINEGGGGFSVPFDVAFNIAQGADLTAIYGDLAPFINPENPTYGDFTSQEAIDVISQYASGLGPWKNNILLREAIDTPVDGNGDGVAEITTQLTGEIFPLIDRAHEAGLQVHPYTLRDEERFLTLNPDGTPQSPEEEFEQLIQIGADGFFTDFARTGDPVRDRLVADTVRSPQNPDFDFNTLNGQTPLVIAHRGASGDFPEHTLEAYRLAIYQGADFVEPDLAITSDGVLIARHEPILDDTTNVAEIFGPERQSTKILDGEEITAYFAEDFTLAEIKQLRARERIPGTRPGNAEFNDLFEIPTLAEVIDLVNELSPFVGREIGIYPETKHPTFFDDQGLSLEEPLIQTLLATGFTDPARIFIQSFEIANLLELQTLLADSGMGDIPLVQLFGDTEGSFINAGGGGFSVPFDVAANIAAGADLNAIYGELAPFINTENPTYGDLANAEAIEVISSYASGLGPWKNNILLREPIDPPVDGNGDGNAQITSQLTGEIVPLIDFAHDAGLQIHPYTLRDEENFLTLHPDGTPQTTGDEFRQLFELGVDGVFTDFTRTGRTVLEDLIPNTVEEPNLRQSRGYEGLALSPDGTTLYPLLEGTVAGDPEGSLRIYEFDLTTGAFTDELVGFYPLDEPNHAIGDFTPINNTEFLVIERDGRQGAAAAFKKIFKIDLSVVDDNGFVSKEEVVDLLNIEDPDDLNGDGETTFTFPFVTIEDVLVLNENTILVANDNNYPFSVGRDLSGTEIDNNEIIQIQLDEPLTVAPSLGTASQSSELVSGSTDSDDLFANPNDAGSVLDGIRDVVFTGAGDDTVELDFAVTNAFAGNNRVNTGSGADVITVSRRDRISGSTGDDLFDAELSDGNNRMSGGDGDDDFILGGHRDRALGGDGDDTFEILFTATDNILAGGAGMDEFFLLPGGDMPVGDPSHQILDFEVGIDVLSFGIGIMATDVAVSSDGSNATLLIFGAELATFSGVSQADLQGVVDQVLG